jgi:hypothetical protein
MKHLRRISLMISIMALCALSCQTVTRMFTLSSPTPRPLPTRARPTQARPRPTATTPQGEAPTQPESQTPTQPGGAVSTPATPGTGGAPTLSSPADTETALSGSTPPQFLEELATEQYSPSQMQQMNHAFPYTIMLKGEQPVLWQWGWCATTQTILDQNLKQITAAFSMNGQPVDLSQFYAYDSQQTDPTTNTTLPCHSLATVVSNWPKGATALQTVVTFASKINDGMNDYAAGNQTFNYAVTRP